jgi:hypothetical protein
MEHHKTELSLFNQFKTASDLGISVCYGFFTTITWREKSYTFFYYFESNQLRHFIESIASPGFPNAQPSTDGTSDRAPQVPDSSPNLQPAVDEVPRIPAPAMSAAGSFPLAAVAASAATFKFGMF